MSITYKQVDRFVVSSKLLGSGSYGQVYKGFFNDESRRVVAVKVVSLQNLTTDRQFRSLKNEIQNLMIVRDPNIVEMYHATRTTNNLYMFLEYCNEGDLQQLLQLRGGKLPEIEAIQIFRQISEGFRALYEQQIIHRDIKPANIMIKEGKALISDFGFSKCLDYCGMEEQTKQTILGSPLYMAPQVLYMEEFSSKCDIWSLGIVFFQILYGEVPWNGNTIVSHYEQIQTKPLQFPEHTQTSQLVKDMIQKMLKIEESDRICWPELFQHPLIQKDISEIQGMISEQNESNDIQISSQQNQQQQSNQNSTSQLAQQSTSITTSVQQQQQQQFLTQSSQQNQQMQQQQQSQQSQQEKQQLSQQSQQIQSQLSQSQQQNSVQVLQQQ